MYSSKRSFIVIVVFISVIAVCWSLVRCENSPVIKQEDGRSLSKKTCGSCHEYPSANLLDQESWTEHVLPAMAPKLGIKVYAGSQYVNDPSSHTSVTYLEWLKIVEYYKSAAPKVLSKVHPAIAPLNDWGVFALHKPSYKVPVATTTLVVFDSISHSIYTSEALNGNLYKWSPDLQLKGKMQFNSPAVDAKFTKLNGKANGFFTFIGSMKAIDIANGNLADIDLNNFNGAEKGNDIADSLPRPVQSLPADFNKDGLTDWLVCGFGHNTGGLYWYKQLANKTYQKLTISSMPGAAHAVIGDFNHDGWPDVACLFAQAEEGVWLFLNNHSGGFTTSNLLRFPPVYGSSSFQFADFNNDGRPDILYTSGDNSDYSKVLKPYHGVYIYLNQGGFKYKKAWFYPVNGATKAVAADFNGDGKKDVALIAFFADLLHNPSEGFTYFEQGKLMQFTPHNLPIAKEGRWISMDVADYNADGKPDIILGNFSLGFINEDGFKPNWNTTTPFIVLENIHK